MKKIVSSFAAIAALGTFAVAGGDIAPVEPAVETPAVEAASADNGFYLGIGYSRMSGDIRKEAVLTGDVLKLENDYDTFMLQAGYKINAYVAVEGRYWNTIGDADTTVRWNGNPEVVADKGAFDMDGFGIFVKPMYPVMEKQLNVYALLGYATTNLNGDSMVKEYTGATKLLDEDGFAWGVGAEYSFNDNLSVFVDYTSLYDSDDTTNGIKTDAQVDGWNFGVTYKF